MGESDVPRGPERIRRELEASPVAAGPKEEVVTCPVCRAPDVRPSHRRGTLERGPLTWLRIFPFRCRQCQTRFYKIALKDHRRRRGVVDAVLPGALLRAPRWNTNIPVDVTVHETGRGSSILQGVAVNVSVEGARLRLPRVLPEGTEVSVTLKEGVTQLGRVRWAVAQDELEILHGVRFQVPVEGRASHLRAIRWLRWRKHLRRGVITMIGLAAIAGAAYAFAWWHEQFRNYDPKQYEHNDTERQQFEQGQRPEGSKRSTTP